MAFPSALLLALGLMLSNAIYAYGGIDGQPEGASQVLPVHSLGAPNQTDSRHSSSNRGWNLIASSENTQTPIGYLHTPRPQYPPTARRLGLTGTVVLRVLVSTQGDPKEIQVLESSGYAFLDKAAREAVEKWRFSPQKINGEPRENWAKIPISFNLRTNQGQSETNRSSGDKVLMKNYAEAISAKIRSQIRFDPSEAPENPEAIYLVEQLPSGQIENVSLAKSSGRHEWDGAVLNAIWASDPLPRAENGHVERVLELRFRPYRRLE